MSSTEDLRLLPNSDLIRRREFATIRRGYDPDQVRDYLQQIATQVDLLEQELREARLHAAQQGQVVTLDEQGPADDPYERLAARVADVLRASDEHAERIRVDAQSHAEDARRQGNEILQNAKVEAERVLSSLSARRETFVEQLQQMQSRLIGVAQELEAGAREFDLLDAMSEEPVATQPVATKPAVGGATTEAGDEDDPIDPRYEDLSSLTWAFAGCAWHGAEIRPLGRQRLELRSRLVLIPLRVAGCSRASFTASVGQTPR